MTPEQLEMAEASIRAAIARETARLARQATGVTGRRYKRAVSSRWMHDYNTERMPFPSGNQPQKTKPSSASNNKRPRKIHSPRALIKQMEESLPFNLPENKPRKPNLHAANLSFAARVIIWIRDRYANDAPSIYKAAYLSRKTYSAIISNENHLVSKRTAIQLAFALRLTREEADLLLHAAGYHLSRSVLEDMIFDACLEAKIYDLEDVNHFLLAYGCRPFVPQE